MSTTVLLVDDHELIRQGLARAFERDDDMTVVGQAGGVAAGLAAWADLRPDVVVTDLQMPDGHGLDVVRGVRRTCESTRLGVGPGEDRQGHIEIPAHRRFVRSSRSS